MKSLLRLPLLLAVLATAALQAAPVEKSPASAAASPGHPLRGVVTEILPGKHLVLIKHEAIPGFMMAMTMAFSVPDEVYPLLKPGTALTARLHDEGAGGWRLDQVKLLLADGDPIAAGTVSTVSLAANGDTHHGRIRFTAPAAGQWRVCVAAKSTWIDVVPAGGAKLTSVACQHTLPAGFQKGVVYPLTAGATYDIVFERAPEASIDVLVGPVATTASQP